jgi:hypothetical protein
MCNIKTLVEKSGNLDELNGSDNMPTILNDQFAKIKSFFKTNTQSDAPSDTPSDTPSNTTLLKSFSGTKMNIPTRARGDNSLHFSRYMF